MKIITARFTNELINEDRVMVPQEIVLSNWVELSESEYSNSRVPVMKGIITSNQLTSQGVYYSQGDFDLSIEFEPFKWFEVGRVRVYEQRKFFGYTVKFVMSGEDARVLHKFLSTHKILDKKKVKLSRPLTPKRKPIFVGRRLGVRKK